MYTEMSTVDLDFSLSSVGCSRDSRAGIASSLSADVRLPASARLVDCPVSRASARDDV